MEFQLDHAVEILAQTPATLDALLRHKSPTWLNARKSPEAFSAIDVVGHLTLAETTNWLPRIRSILAGDLSPFPPFDRFDFQLLIATSRSPVCSTTSRSSAAKASPTWPASTSPNPNSIYPEPTHNSAPSPCATCLATWAVHDLAHTSQIVKTFAHEYREAVGPWKAYLPILH